MSFWTDLWAALNRPVHLPAARRAAPPAPPLEGPPRAAATPRSARAFAVDRRRARATADAAATRQSRDPEELNDLLGRYEARFAAHPNDTRRRLIKVIRGLVQNDEDLSGAMNDLIILANPGHTLEFTGGARAVKQAREELERWLLTIYPEGGGIDGLVNNQIAEAYKTGGTSLEWYTSRRRDAVAGVAVVQGESVIIRRDGDSWAFLQRHRLEDVPLDPLTFRYVPVLTDGASPYGIPLCVSALEAVDRKRRLTANTDRVLDLMGKLAVVAATVPNPSPQDIGLDSVSDPGWAEARAGWYAEALDLLLEFAQEGVFVGPEGTEFKVTNVTQSLAGLADLVKENQRRVWTAAKTLGFMRGYPDATTEALAKIVYPILEALAGNVQLALARQLEFGFNLHLRLRGIAAQVWVRFEQPDSAFAMDKASVEKTRMETDALGKQVFGDAWWAKAAQRWDIDAKDAEQAPDFWKGASAPANAVLPSEGTAAMNEPRAHLLLAYDRQTRRYATAPRLGVRVA